MVDHEAEGRNVQELAKQPEVDRPRQEVEEEEEREKAAARKVQAKEKAKQAAIVAEAERQKRKEARLSPPPVSYVSKPLLLKGPFF